MGARLYGDAVRGEYTPSVEDVKAEAGRRIEAIMPDYKQRNALAAGLAAVTQFGNNPANWPAGAREQYEETMPLWERIEQLRAISNQIEAMDPIPADFKNDTYWL